MKLSFIKSIPKKTFEFVRDVTIVVKNQAVQFAKGFWHHIESVTILTLSSIGLSSLLSEIPFYYTLPMWIESPMVIPVVSVLIIIGLVMLAEHRANKRNIPAEATFNTDPAYAMI